jgi:hypothetical protein
MSRPLARKVAPAVCAQDAICLRHHPLSSRSVEKKEREWILAMTRTLHLGIGASGPMARRPSWGRCATGLPWSIALVFLLMACAQNHDEALNLPVACETRDCDCASDSGYTAKPPPMQWKTDGTAYCPAGYHLHVPPPPSQRMTVQ